MADDSLAIDVEGLTKRFDEKVVVDHFALKVRRGQIYGFLGPNGSGKTTTIRMLCGLLTPDGGRGTCLGFDILRSWIFPRDARFASKAGRVLDLYHKNWLGLQLGADDYVISTDEKTSIQARRRVAETLPPKPDCKMR